MKYWIRTKIESSKSHLALLIFRVAVGGMMLTHGIPKARRVFAGDWRFGDPIGLGSEVSLLLATFAEAGCGILIILGLWTRLASVPLVITMAVAGFIHHAPDPFSTKEKSFLYLAAFILLFFLGGGKYSLDRTLSKPDNY
ncbi:MAG TPA: DoxX family protein [Cyclobacteriaceae bacterium]